MQETFEDALSKLLAQYDTTPLDELISALELRLMALREDERAAERKEGDDVHA